MTSLARVRAVVACGHRKAEHGAPADQLYTGPYHRDMLDAATRVFERPHILILSALHGYVSLDHWLEPYDVTWTHPDAIRSAELADQATEHAWYDPVIVFGGQSYTARVARSARAVQAFAGGMGQQRKQARAFTVSDALALASNRSPTEGMR